MSAMISPLPVTSDFVATVAHKKVLLLFPQTDRVSFGILHPGKSSGRNVDWRHKRFSTEQLRIVEIALHIFDFDIEDGVVMRLVSECGDVSCECVAGINHRGGAGLFEFPAEQPGIKA